MATKNNAAARLFAVLQPAPRAVAADAITAVGWASVFGLTNLDEAARDHEAARLLGVAREQLILIRAAMQRVGPDDSAYSTQFQSIERTLSVRLLGVPWESVRKSLTEGALSALGLAAFLLPEDEPGLEPEDIANTQAVIAELRARVDGAELPAAVKSFLSREVAVMEAAVREYPLRGPAAFRDASEQAASDWIDHATDLLPFRNDSIVQDVEAFWPAAKNAYRSVSIIGRMVYHLWIAGTPILVAAHRLQLLPEAIDTIVAEVIDPIPTMSKQQYLPAPDVEIEPLPPDEHPPQHVL